MVIVSISYYCKRKSSISNAVFSHILEPEAKKLAGSGSEFSSPPQQLQRTPLPSVMGFSNDGTFSEEIMVPDKIVGLSKLCHL